MVLCFENLGSPTVEYLEDILPGYEGENGCNHVVRPVVIGCKGIGHEDFRDHEYATHIRPAESLVSPGVAIILFGQDPVADLILYLLLGYKAQVILA